MAVPKKRVRIKPDQKSSAIEKVLATTELLEQILLNMRIKDILVNGQRVNKAWNATIQQSIKLQRALFFEPLPEKCKREVVEHRGKVIAHRMMFEPQVANPWIRYLMPPTIPGSWIRYCMQQYSVLPTYDDSEPSEKRLQDLARKDASWRRMLVSQPPAVGVSGDPIRLEQVTPDEGADKPYHVADWLKMCTAEYAWEVSESTISTADARWPLRKQGPTVFSKAEIEEDTSDNEKE